MTKLTYRLLASVALGALGIGIAAAATLATSGYWTAMGNPPEDGGAASCGIVSVTSDGRAIAFSVNAGDQQLRASVIKPTWEVPPGTKASITFQVDGYSPWGGPNLAFTIAGQPHGMGEYVATAGYREFVHEITSGSTLTVQFSGNEPNWVFSLSGTTAVWGAFMQCAEGVAPTFVQAMAPATQPFAATPAEPTQPYSIVPSAPAQQQPSVPADSL